MKVKKHRPIELNGYFDFPITVTLQLVPMFHHTNTLICRFKILHISRHVYIFQLQIFQQNVYFSQSYCAPISLRSVFGACVRTKLSLWSLAENRKSKAHALLTAKWTYFHGFLTFTDGEYTCEM